MTTGRLEAFSDGVIAIIVTIMVLELKAPHDATIEHLKALLPEFGSYALSFGLVAIYWVNHQHLVHLLRRVDPFTLWSNLLLLFCLSLMPFATAYIGETRFSSLAVSIYAGTQTACSLSWALLTYAIFRQDGKRKLAKDESKMLAKCHFCSVLTAIAVATAFLSPVAAIGLLVIPPILYFIPERVKPTGA